MANVKYALNIVIAAGLYAVLNLTGCASVGRSVEVLPPATLSVDFPTLTPLPLPEPTPTPEPTPAPTQVIFYIATSTKTPTPTRAPTQTPTPTSLPAATTGPVLAQVVPPPRAKIEHVVIISVDGLRPDALDLANTPNLDILRAAGVYSPRAKAVVPSVTLNNHASMLGGMSPAKHGITWNVYDPTLGKINGPTLFSVAHEAGLSTAMVVGKTKFTHLVLPNTVDNYIYAGFTDRLVVNQALELIQAGLPDILFIHLPDIDSAGHLSGWMSPGQLETLTLTDGLVGEIVNALETRGSLDDTLIIVTSDHGGSGRMHGRDSPEDTLIPWLAVGPNVPAGVTLEGDIVMYDTAATVLYVFDLPIPDVWDGRPILETFR